VESACQHLRACVDDPSISRLQNRLNNKHDASVTLHLSAESSLSAVHAEAEKMKDKIKYNVLAQRE